MKENFRGNGLGGLLFYQVISYLSTQYYSEKWGKLFQEEQQEGTPNDTNKNSSSSPWFTFAHEPVVLLLLDAEEDTKRHNKLRQFYESMGCTVSPDARIRYLHNNDVETYRKIPMQMYVHPLVVKHSQEMEERRPGFKSYKSLTGSYFVPIKFSTVSSYADNNSNTANETLPTIRPVHVTHQLQQKHTLIKQPNDIDWIILDENENGISFQTTQGLYMYATSDGRIVADGGPPPARHNLQWIYFTLQRTYDRNITIGATHNSTVPAGGTNDNYRQLWTLQSCHGSYLCVGKDDNNHPNRRYILTTTNFPVFWMVHTTNSSTSDKQTLLLLCLRDTPIRRRYYEQWWTHQTVAYNKSMRELYMQQVPYDDVDDNNNNCTKLSIREALLQKAKSLPWYRLCRNYTYPWTTGLGSTYCSTVSILV